MHIKKFKLTLTKLFLFIIIGVNSSAVLAEQTYQKPLDFVKESFSLNPPKSKVLWITKSLKPSIYEILGHDLGVLRVRYWAKDGQTVWVLNEIGKQHPITVGFVVKENKIQRLKVLIFRENRG